MQSLTQALQEARDGWDVASDIIYRAAEMRFHAKHGNGELAEEYASEIDHLQLAMMNKFQGTNEVLDTKDWKLAHEKWATLLIPGFRVIRYFDGLGPAAQAQRCYGHRSVNSFTASDFTSTLKEKDND